MSIKGKSIPPLIKNAATAPVVFFDNAPMFGAFSGNVEVELTTRILVPKSDGVTIGGDAVCVAHLRCSPAGALALADALMKAKQPPSLAEQAESVLHS